MTANLQHLADARHCPVCEYNLQGNVSGRCPECGTTIAGFAASRLPWSYRQARGGVKAYMQTVALLLFKPDRIAAEARRRIPRLPAARFHQESVALATIIGTGMITICYLLRGSRWEPWLNPPIQRLFTSTGLENPLVALPLSIWSDRLFFLLPFIPALYLAIQASLWSYRLLFSLGPTQCPIARRRSARIAYYGSGLAPVIVLLLCLILALALLCADDWSWAIGAWRPMLRALIALLMLVVLAAFYRPTFVLLTRAGRSSAGRMLAMGVAFPLVQIVVWLVILSATFWVCGYATIAVWAMTH